MQFSLWDYILQSGAEAFIAWNLDLDLVLLSFNNHTVGLHIESLLGLQYSTWIDKTWEMQYSWNTRSIIIINTSLIRLSNMSRTNKHLVQTVHKPVPPGYRNSLTYWQINEEKYSYQKKTEWGFIYVFMYFDSFVLFYDLLHMSFDTIPVVNRKVI